MYKKNSYCSYCGSKFPEKFSFPIACITCSQTTYSNPIPVAVILLPVDEGILLVRRGIEPAKGRLNINLFALICILPKIGNLKRIANCVRIKFN